MQYKKFQISGHSHLKNIPIATKNVEEFVTVHFVIMQSVYHEDTATSHGWGRGGEGPWSMHHHAPSTWWKGWPGWTA